MSFQNVLRASAPGKVGINRFVEMSGLDLSVRSQKLDVGIVKIAILYRLPMKLCVLT